MIRIIILVLLLGTGLVVGGEEWPDFFDLPSLLITLGGTLTVTLLSFSWKQLSELGRSLFALFTEEQQSQQERIEELKRLGHLYRLEGPRGLENQENSVSDPFLRWGIGMVADLQRGENIHRQLENEALVLFSQREAARQILLTAGKLLPAFGLIGTLIGLLLLLHQIPNGDPDALASALSLAILSTLYGALLANIVVLPLAAKLQSAGLEREAMMHLTLEGVVSMARGEASATIERRLGALFPTTQYGQSTAKTWRRLLPSP